MGEVYADPTALHGLAAELDRASGRLTTLTGRARSLGSDEAVASLGDLTGWASERAAVLRLSAAVAESIEGQIVDWDKAMEPGNPLMLAASQLGFDPFTPAPGEGHLPGLDAVLAGLPPGASAADRAQSISAWWNQLSPTEQVAVLSRHAEQLGNLDGVPFGARAHANWARLATEKQHITTELGTFPQGPANGLLSPGEYLTPEQHDRVLFLQSRLAAVTAIEQTMKLPDRHLVSLDHMASLNKTGRDLTRKPGGSTSTFASVAWIGYNAPQWGETPASTRPATTTRTSPRWVTPTAR